MKLLQSKGFIISRLVHFHSIYIQEGSFVSKSYPCFQPSFLSRHQYVWLEQNKVSLKAKCLEAKSLGEKVNHTRRNLGGVHVCSLFPTSLSRFILLILLWVRCLFSLQGHFSPFAQNRSKLRFSSAGLALRCMTTVCPMANRMLKKRGYATGLKQKKQGSCPIQ